MEETRNELTPIMSEHKTGLVESLGYWIMGILAFLLPFFFIPSTLVPFQMGKGVLVTVGVVLALIFYIVSIIKNGVLQIPTNLFFLGVLLLPVSFFLSALVNNVGQRGYIGFTFETGTVAIVLLGSLLLFITSQVFNTKEKIFYSYLGFIGASLIVALFQIVRLLFGSATLSFGVLLSPVDNLVGSWNELGLFFGAVLLLSLISLESLVLNKTLKNVFYGVFVVSLLGVMLVDFALAWYLLALFSLAFFVYFISFDKFTESKELAHDFHINNDHESTPPATRKISYKALFVLCVSVLFILSGSAITSKTHSALGISNLDVRPTIGTTWTVAKGALSQNLLLGVGPNQFSRAWLMYKPADINQSIFWDTDFSSGFGLLPTYLATVGVVGVAAWIFFLALFLSTGVRALFSNTLDPFSRFIVSSSFFISLYFWVLVTVYVPNVTLFILAFFFTGLYAAVLIQNSFLKTRIFSLSHHPKASFVSVLVLVMVLVGTVSLGYAVIQRNLSFVYLQRAITEVQANQDISRAEELIGQAIAMGRYDIHYRTLAELQLLKLNRVLGQDAEDTDALVAEVQSILAISIESAREATRINPSNYQNWVSLARIYADLVPPPLSVPGAYDNALAAYQEAVKHNPHNPGLYLLLARLEVANNSIPAAREYVLQAIEKKDNFAEAHFLLSQIEVDQGNTEQAITSLERTLLLSPNNPGLFFQLGLLYYNEESWESAANSFRTATRLVADYANAKYFLGLSYARLGAFDQAIAEFEALRETNPENQEVVLILENLRAGNDPFFGIQAPLDAQPEQREDLPIEE